MMMQTVFGISLFLALIQSSYSQCPQGAFGLNCEYSCHCKNGEQCDRTTGECPSGCNSQWMGMACQFENIALEAISRHLDNTGNHLWALFANDDNVTSCSETDYDYNGNKRRVSPLWRVYFGQTEVIRRILLSPRDNSITYFTQGFNITVEIIPDDEIYNNYFYPTNTKVCYQHTRGANLSIPFEINCGDGFSGNQVRVQLSSKDTQLALCDVKISGDSAYPFLNCPVNFCGNNCDVTCFCKEPTFQDKLSGTCSSGCTGRWTGFDNRCDKECSSIEWGSDCASACGNCLNGAACDVKDGKCSNGCAPGYIGALCDKECPEGKYGPNCEQTCSPNCDGSCNHIYGHCEQGCVDGYMGDQCDQQCNRGHYGKGCLQTCSVNCKLQDQCNHTDGICDDGCTPGWQDGRCDQECSEGKYGPNCVQTCSPNCDGSCNHIDGNCEQGCIAGYMGDQCENPCTSGRYGKECLKNCSINCITRYHCNNIDGTCYDGCSPGWQNGRCETQCLHGYYGLNCSETCGSCRDGPCVKENGTCLQGCMDGFEGSGCEKLIDHGNAIPVGGIVGGSVGALVGIAVIVVGFIFIRRRQKKNNGMKYVESNSARSTLERKTSGKRNDIYENSGVFVGIKVEENKNSLAEDVPQKADKPMEDDFKANDNIYYNSINDMAPRSAIYLSNMRDYIVTHRTTSKFIEEFKSVPYGLQYPTTAALKQRNRSKNRYKDMYPYDHSRVVLEELPDCPDSDYINACYVDGYDKPREFIAAQGPVDSNVADFWRMIWEKNVNTIIMLTNPVEKGKMKCLQYWKEDDYKTISVKTKSEEVFCEWTIRTFEITKINEQKSITVKQYHFTAWPDKSTPYGATGLVQFLHCTRKHWKVGGAPVVVHCSAGVGRTGTFIAMDYLYEQGRKHGYIDILGTTNKLREQRVNAVQTKGQYAFLHEAAYEMLVLPKPLDISTFVTEYNQLLEVDNDTGNVTLLDQFKKVQEFLISEEMRNGFNDIRNENSDFSEAKKTENKGRNRYANIIAANAFRPFLSTPVEGCNNYINAVYIQGNTDPYSYLITQSPLETTAIDCCRLIMERSIRCVVTFDWSTLKQNEKYLPEKNSSITIGPFKITNTTEEVKSGYTVRNHTLENKGSNYAVEQFIYTDWDVNQVLPKNLTTFTKFLEEMQSVKRGMEGTLLVQCLNGADKSGLFIVLMNVIEKLKSDGEVLISQTVRQAKLRREQIIPAYVQYKFCHELIQCHLEETNVYANV